MKHRAFYLCKYLSKLEDKTFFPKGFRLFGTSISKGLLTDFELWTFRMTNYPKWLYNFMLSKGFAGVLPKRVEGGGWLLDARYNIVVYSDWTFERSPEITDPEQVINPENLRARTNIFDKTVTYR
jgi:hypothetical protein